MTDYDTYIQSDAWRERADAAKERAGWCCQLCNSHVSGTVLSAHHRTYERLGQEKPMDITVLCSDCHARHHGRRGSESESIRKILSSGRIQGIGPVMAERIVDMFGPDTIDALDRGDRRLLEVGGMGPIRLSRIYASWKEYRNGDTNG